MRNWASGQTIAASDRVSIVWSTFVSRQYLEKSQQQEKQIHIGGAPSFPTATSTCKSTSLFRCVLRITAFVLFHLNDSYLRNKRVRPVKATDKIIKNVVGVLVLGKEERGTRCCLKGKALSTFSGYEPRPTTQNELCHRNDGVPSFFSKPSKFMHTELVGAKFRCSSVRRRRSMLEASIIIHHHDNIHPQSTLPAAGGPSHLQPPLSSSQ